LSEGEVLQGDRVMASSEQPNELKQTQQDYEHVAQIVPSRLLKSQYGLDDLVLANHTLDRSHLWKDSFA
jgi:hypothetical protein